MTAIAQEVPSIAERYPGFLSPDVAEADREKWAQQVAEVVFFSHLDQLAEVRNVDIDVARGSLVLSVPAYYEKHKFSQGEDLINDVALSVLPRYFPGSRSGLSDERTDWSGVESLAGILYDTTGAARQGGDCSARLIVRTALGFDHPDTKTNVAIARSDWGRLEFREKTNLEIYDGPTSLAKLRWLSGEIVRQFGGNHDVLDAKEMYEREQPHNDFLDFLVDRKKTIAFVVRDQFGLEPVLPLAE